MPHIYRGDLLNWFFAPTRLRRNQAEAGDRLIKASAYTTLLNQLFSKLVNYGTKNIRVTVLCEGMESPAGIPGINGGIIDLRREITTVIQNVTFVPGDADPMQSFDDMCYSDILITGGSSFSFLAEYLCNKPVVLSMPSFMQTDYITNSILLDVGRGEYEINSPRADRPGSFVASLIDRAEFDEKNLTIFGKTDLGQSTCSFPMSMLVSGLLLRQKPSLHLPAAAGKENMHDPRM